MAFEGTIVSRLKAEFFWRGPYKNEVDVVLTNGKPAPIGVKLKKPDYGGPSTFMKRFGV